MAEIHYAKQLRPSHSCGEGVMTCIAPWEIFSVPNELKVSEVLEVDVRRALAKIKELDSLNCSTWAAKGLQSLLDL